MIGISMEQLQKIIDDMDYESMFQLENNRDFGFVLSQILNKYHECNDLNTIPRSHKMLFLCKVVEDCCQAEYIGTFYEWGFSKYKDDTYTALLEINAPISAKALKKACNILDKEALKLPLSDEDNNKLVDLDSTISNYPDGHFSELYRIYAEKYKSDFV